MDSIKTWTEQSQSQSESIHAVILQSPALYLIWYGFLLYTHHLLWSGTQGTETYPPPPLFILNEYATRYAVTCHYLGLVDVDK